jgi:hypothetical protein
MSVPAAPVPPAGAGQVVIPAGGVRLAELSVGQVYRVTVTAVMPGKAEILIGNQYLLAATPFRFSEGDTLALKLIARTPELLQFQLALPAGSAEAEAQDLATLLRAAAMPDTVDNRNALALLLQSGVAVSARTMQDALALLSAMPLAAALSSMPLYKELTERNIRLDKALTLQLARLQLSAPGLPPLAGALAGALAQIQRERVRGGQRRKALEDALSAALGGVGAEASAASAQELKERAGLLYGAPEKALLDMLKALSAADQPQQQSAPALELNDLPNLLAGEELPPEVLNALLMLQAVRIVNALAPQRLALALPTLIAEEPTDVQLSLQTLAEQYYHKDYALRIRVENETQGKVEFQLRTRGPGLYVDVLAEDETTRAAYEAQAGRFREELEQGAGFIVRKLEVGQQSL